MDITGIVLMRGCHKSRDEGMCIMEAAAYIAGEEHSDQPACVSTAIADVLRTLNDGLSNDQLRTDLLMPLLPKILNTAATPYVESKRSYMAFCVPAWLDTIGLHAEANSIRSVNTITNVDSSQACMTHLKSAYAAYYNEELSMCHQRYGDVTSEAASDAVGGRGCREVRCEAVYAVAYSAKVARAKGIDTEPLATELRNSVCDLVLRMAALT